MSVTACSEADPAHEEPDALGNQAAALTTACTYNTKTKLMTVTVESGERAILTKRADGYLLVNNETCGDAIAKTTKNIDIVENLGAPGNEDIVIDIGAGVFAIGTTSVPGIRAKLGSGDDTIGIRGGDAVDKVAMGAKGVGLNGDQNVDLSVTTTGTVTYTITLGKGDDVFSAAGVFTKDTPYLGPVVVYGGDGNDKLTGGSGNDQLYGGDGNDSLKGGLGDDTCSGDAGDDIYDESRTTVTNGNDIYVDSAGSADKIDYSTRTGALVIDIEAAGTGTNDDGEVALSEADQVDSGIDIVLGGAGNDTLSGDGGDNTLTGGAGNDILSGGAGADILNGDAGNDRFDEGGSANGGDVFNGGAGVDTVDYSARNGAITVTMDGAAADDGEGENDNVKADIENCFTGAGGDDVTGNALANLLAGGASADTLRGEGGNDRFDEGASANGGDTFIGGSGFDAVDYSGRANAINATFDGAADDGQGSENDLISDDIESCSGGAGNDTMTGGDRDDELNGGGGNDTLHGGAGNDALGGDDGDDTLYGEAGEDTLDGGDGSGDTLDCGVGDADIGYNAESSSHCEL